MRKFFDLFRLRNEERLPAIGILLLMVLINVLVVTAYAPRFLQPADDYWKLFVNGFKVSGFDPITYYVISEWDTAYNVYRHPLLAFFWFPAYALNQGLTALFGINFAPLMVAAVQVVTGVYTFVFMRRIFREQIGLERWDATLPAAMLFSFAYVLLSLCVPDHFSLSMFLLVFTLYLSGRKMQTGTTWTKCQTVMMFVLTAGVSLNNGIKTFLAALFVNGKKTFRWRFLLLAVLLPSALIWGFCRLEYRVYVWPQEMAKKAKKARIDSIARARIYQKVSDTISIKDTALIAAGVKAEINKRAWAKFRRDHAKTGKPLAKGEFMRWTDISTSRSSTFVENLFGEAFLLHRDHLLEDTLRSRPVIVPYSSALPYVVMGLMSVLILGGIWCGRRQKLLWLAMSFFGFDMFIHFALGFGINEIYIMSPHWAFVFPMAIACLLKRSEGKQRIALRVVLVGLWLFMLAYNLSLMYIGIA